MGLMEFLRQWPRGRLVAGVLASIALHALVIALVFGVRLPGTRYDLKRGEPLIVELPKGDDSPPPGRGSAPASAPSPPPSAPAPRAAARPAPPAPKVAAPSAPRAPEPAGQPAPRPQPEPPRQVASAPAAPVAEPTPVPAPPPVPAKPEPSPQPQPAETPTAETPAQPAVGRPQVAALPPQPAGRPAPDALSALRRGAGGAGGSGEGRTGIEGEPIPLDSKDPKYSDYLDRVRRAIKEKWGFPCVKNAATHECEYKSAQLIIEFGIAKDGKVPFVNVVRSSGYPIYDDYAVNAVKLAAPFPPIPDSFSKSGVPIHATFSYVVESSLANILR